MNGRAASLPTLTLSIRWSGPYKPHEMAEFSDGGSSPRYEGEDYGVYQIYGRHQLAGRRALLYIGKAVRQTFARRFAQHATWLSDEQDVKIFLGRLDPHTRHSRRDRWKMWERDVELVERLLIYKYSPHYNGVAIARPPVLSQRVVILRHRGERHRLDDEDLAPEHWTWRAG